MPRLPSLPERLRYLQPFRKQVAKLKPEEIDESVDLSVLNKLLLERIKGIPIHEGKAKLEADRESLEQWLSLTDLNDNGSMVFLQGYLSALPELVDRLLEEQDRPKPEQQQLQMELPPEAKTRHFPFGVWKVRWSNATLFLHPSDKKYIDFQINDFYEGERHKLSKVTVTSVKFGEINGFKRYVDLSIIESVSVDYALEVPGGFVTVLLLKKGVSIDAQKFEQFFHTIRITPAQF